VIAAAGRNASARPAGWVRNLLNLLKRTLILILSAEISLTLQATMLKRGDRLAAVKSVGCCSMEPGRDSKHDQENEVGEHL
jgi:hypothetical protein